MSTMSNNGQQPQAMIPGDALGLGATIDGDGDPVVLVWIAKDPLGILACSLTSIAARQLAAGLMNFADEADRLEKDLAGLSDEEIRDRMEELTNIDLSGGAGAEQPADEDDEGVVQ